MKGFFLLALLFSVRAWAGFPACQTRLQPGAQTGQVSPALLSTPLLSRASTDSQRFGYKELKEFVQRNGITKKDQFVERLPEAQKLRVSKVFASRSFHFLGPAGEDVPAATPDEPRVILANKDSSLLIALSTRTVKTDMSLIEILEFNPALDAFVPRAIEFKDGKAGFIDDPLSHFPKGNKAHCARCHGEDIKPIYDSYHDWVGFWGQSNPGGGIEGLRRESKYFGPEVAHLKEKAEAWKKAPILRHLDRPEPNVQLTTDNTFMESEMITLMARRAVRKMAQSPNFKKYSIPLFLSLVNFGGTVDGLPEFDPDVKRAEIREKLSRASDAKRARFLRVNSHWLTPSSRVEDLGFITDAGTAASLALFAELMGVSISDWSLNFEDDVPAFNSGVKYLALEILKVLKEELAIRYPALGLSDPDFDGSPQRFFGSKKFREEIEPALVRIYRSGP
jgi:hypothetical protein